MARTVEQGIEVFLRRLVPRASERQARKLHRDTVERALRRELDVVSIREIGSFSHGTGVRGHCDADVLVTPGFYTGRTDDDELIYEIPGAASDWIESAPEAHLSYVTEINGMDKIAGGAKKLARLAKAWKYYNNVPISSFYLEMRAARYLEDESSFMPVYAISRLLNTLKNDGLAAMNDPMGVAGRFRACSTILKKQDALSKLANAARRARRTADAFEDGDPATAFRYLNLLFGGNFPLTERFRILRSSTPSALGRTNTGTRPRAKS